MRGQVSRRYEELATAGELRPDHVQRALVAELDRLADDLGQAGTASKKSSLGWLFARNAKPQPLRGLYIWGGVGRGKTLLMDLFFRAAPDIGKRRVHFHEFMGEVHDVLHRVRGKLRNGELPGDDPMPHVAAEVGAGLRLLCFDEFAVNDIADAMILGRLFEQLFARGLVVVATSNVPPERLYESGLNRPLFLPFIALLEKQMSVFHLDSPRDYRLGRDGDDPFYVTPLGPEADALLQSQFRRLSGQAHGAPAEIANKGRRIPVPEAANSVARFSFEDLCARPLGASDYLKLAAAFHTIVLSGVPLLGHANRNEARRFITLIDTLYDNRIRLVVSAAAEPDALWTGTTGHEAFEFARTASRLAEMRNESFWAEEPRTTLETTPSAAAKRGA
jgi:cell division protein ZapE